MVLQIQKVIIKKNILVFQEIIPLCLFEAVWLFFVMICYFYS